MGGMEPSEVMPWLYPCRRTLAWILPLTSAQPCSAVFSVYYVPRFQESLFPLTSSSLLFFRSPNMQYPLLVFPRPSTFIMDRSELVICQCTESIMKSPYHFLEGPKQSGSATSLTSSSTTLLFHPSTVVTLGFL